MASRFCVPLFASGWLLGHMMVIDTHQSLTSEERTRIELAGAEIAAQLYADRLETDPGHLERQMKTQALLSEHERTRLDALAFFAKEANLANAQYVVVTMVQVTVGDATKASIDIALNLALETANPTHSRRSLHLVEDNGALLLQADSNEIHCDVLQDQADRIVVELGRSLGRRCRVDVGIGADHGGLDTAWLARRLADTALFASQRQSTTKNAATAFWADLGVDALLLRLPETDLTLDNVPASVRALHEQDRDGKLLHTMLVYLDHGGSISSTANAMHLHRTTLYYRLDQIRKATGLDLDDGRNRLELHIGLHLLRLVLPSSISDR
ncbi:PucR family transcriptional regulator [Arthrobacter sp. NPDC057013]|uniref:PucR family transcriptional regulator n=1 Tax=Arthrobacter sp. NPDC057013 TaxID=3345999 RepID=UPI003631E6CE